MHTYFGGLQVAINAAWHQTEEIYLQSNIFKGMKLYIWYFLALNTVIKQNGHSNSFLMHSCFTHCLCPFWCVMGPPLGVWASLWSVGPLGSGHSPVWAWWPLAGPGCFLCLVSLWASLGRVLLHLCSPVGSSLRWVFGSLIGLGLLAL